MLRIWYYLVTRLLFSRQDSDSTILDFFYSLHKQSYHVFKVTKLNHANCHGKSITKPSFYVYLSLSLLSIELYSQKRTNQWWTHQTSISALHWCSLWQLLLLPQNMPEQLMLSSSCSSILLSISNPLCEGLDDWTSLSISAASPHVHGLSPQLHIGRDAEGNGLHVSGHTISDETAATRFLRISDLEMIAGSSSAIGFWMQGLQRLRTWFDLISVLAGEARSLTKETMPVRQSGQGIDPDGPVISWWMVLVEQRYSAHLTHSWWPQPDNPKGNQNSHCKVKHTKC